MRHHAGFGSGCVAAALLLCAGLAVAASGTSPETVGVVVKKTAIRKDRQFYAPAVAEAVFGDRLTVLDREKDWVQVKSGPATGWVHATAVTEKTVKASGAAAASGVSSEDITLAGKGFNSQVESEYRKKNPGANFAAVDRMEKLGASEQEIAAFARAGELEPRGGGR